MGEDRAGGIGVYFEGSRQYIGRMGYAGAGSSKFGFCGDEAVCRVIRAEASLKYRLTYSREGVTSAKTSPAAGGPANAYSHILSVLAGALTSASWIGAQ